MVYAAFALWFFLILFAGIGVYRVWAKMVRPLWVNWVLLPGTIVSEMAYIFGCLITGGEIRHAKLLEMPAAKSKGQGKASGDGEPRTDARPGIRVIGPVLASLLSIVACAAAILVAYALLGEPIIGRFMRNGAPGEPALPKSVPTSWSGLWDQLAAHLLLLRRMFEALGDFAWQTWTGPLFVYLAACLSIRLSPVTRPMRPTLAAVVLITALVAVLGLAIEGFDRLVRNAWPLLTYVWANLLALLTITLIVRGLVGLVGALAGKGSPAPRAKARSD